MLKTVLDFIFVETRLYAFFNYLALITPLIGIVVLAFLKFRRSTPRSTFRTGIIIGATGPFLWCAWRVYTGIVHHYGIDSVKGLCINFLIFSLIGIAAGIASRIMDSKKRTHQS